MRLSPQRKRNRRISFRISRKLQRPPTGKIGASIATPRSPKHGGTPLYPSMQERPLDDTGVAVKVVDGRQSLAHSVRALGRRDHGRNRGCWGPRLGKRPVNLNGLLSSDSTVL